MDQCIICSPAEDVLVFRDERGTVLLDGPVRPGHVLVGANIHAPFLHDITGESAAELLSLSQVVAKIIVEQTGAEKVYVVAIGDKDKHFHFHLVPKFAADASLGPYVFGANGWAGTFESAAESGEKAQKRITDAIAGTLGDGN
ncbi:HIT family protein [Micromonospora sp. NPDC049751]|uniref:HIT family protein n=1 Tax=Micromonospora sp. NPDC049751 TaxID=3154837 RepID=UPI0033E8A3EE